MRHTLDQLESSSTLRRTLRLALAMLLCLLVTLPTGIAAQDDTATEGDGQVSEPAPVEPAPIPPTPIPLPTDIPPTPVPPTEVPAPTAVPATEVPVVVEPTEATVTETPLEPTIEPTVELTAEPTGEPTPTPTAESSLTYSLAEKTECTPITGQADTIAAGDWREYECTDRLSVHGIHLVPTDAAVTWTTRAVVEGGWSVQFLSPINPGDAPAEWSAAGAADATMTFAQRNALGTGTEATDLDTTIAMTYRLRVHRAACTESTQTVWLTHDVQLHSPDAEATLDPPLTTPREAQRLTPDLAAIPQPAVAFDGALNFGEIGLTANGPSTAVPTGTLSVVVTNLDQSCGDWTVSVSASDLTDEAGNALPDSQLVVVAVNGQALADGGCDLGTGCNMPTLTAGETAPATETLVLTVELRVPEQASIGTFATTLDAVLAETGTSDAPQRPQQARLAES